MSIHRDSRYMLDLLLNFGCTVYKLVTPELELWVLDELNEGDQQSPGVGPVHYQSLQQYPRICKCL